MLDKQALSETLLHQLRLKIGFEFGQRNPIFKQCFLSPTFAAKYCANTFDTLLGTYLHFT